MDIQKFVKRYFAYKHLPERLQAVSAPFCVLAEQLVALSNIEDPVIHDDRELDVALRKLLEAKDAAVRACVDAHVGRAEQPRRPGPREADRSRRD